LIPRYARCRPGQKTGSQPWYSTTNPSHRKEPFAEGFGCGGQGYIQVLSPDWRGVVSLEPQPFLPCHPWAPKTHWVMVAAFWHRRSDWLKPLRLLWGRFEGKGAVVRRSPFPVANSKETTPLQSGLRQTLRSAVGLHHEVDLVTLAALDTPPPFPYSFFDT
jgi:hypothetical protein